MNRPNFGVCGISYIRLIFLVSLYGNSVGRADEEHEERLYRFVKKDTADYPFAVS